ncbi:UDP-2,4-diacetamido-2,4,6-trideoxy-beta-L-altropyranose hydrolase [Vibrio sp. S12_S33]|uniref:UDP-2,4-diacetamido-2,4, 6-trideoxy-beta-L-altropyranose hydrolase n=1 Tax=Vibrio sp. S12_S33 TaxID=2720223 RepID=UPI0017807EAA|nr:UDP-2,4-diacetamido-2,4,6-trideoxy-beta-L-altropyranose hydrolase [Vibrio sp. S12_S33]MBD1564520.1 UDP-2,4-diacetamido-2,4,6-trideoxy-beta-L-altropyranose hydrolase [Vibrio sp. S12_S33]
MKVVFRVDASLLIGSGHVMRCLVLADQLKQKAYDVTFACTPLEGDMRSFIQQRGFGVITLPAPQQVVAPLHDADYVAWLQKSLAQDVSDFVAAVGSADLVVTDHYAIDEQWQHSVKQAMNCRLLAIDDLARVHCADVVLDQTLGRAEADYRGCASVVLAGSEYAMLQPAFAKKRELALSRKLVSEPSKVLISMGGVDAPNATLKVLESLVPNVHANFTVLLSPRAPHYKEVKQWCAEHHFVTHLDFVSDMASLMLAHDVAIGAPGTTSWERACLGLPNLIVPLADNQKLISQQLVDCQAAIKVEVEDISTRVVSAYSALIERWHEMKLANLALCDGRGVRRVALIINELLTSDKAPLSLVLAAQEDIQLVYEWQCHPRTRKYALNSDPPTWAEHQAWMSKKLTETSDYFYMVTDRLDQRHLGVVRLDRIKVGHYLVSIFVEPGSYGQGVASQALAMVDAIHPDVTLHATVLKSNGASQRLFQRAGYQQVDDETYLRQPID